MLGVIVRVEVVQYALGLAIHVLLEYVLVMDLQHVKVMQHATKENVVVMVSFVPHHFQIIVYPESANVGGLICVPYKVFYQHVWILLGTSLQMGIQLLLVR